mgnify:FL=1
MKILSICSIRHPQIIRRCRLRTGRRSFRLLRLLRGMRMLSGKHSGGWRNGSGRWNREMERKQVKMKNKNLKNVSLAIVDRDSIGSSGSGTINIKRHVFLLSARELCYDVENEGRELEYFNTPDYRIAEYHGEPVSWLLRTPSTFYLSAVCGITQDGQLSLANTYDKFGIRPAFCVDSAEKIIEKEGIVNGKKVYVIE